MSDTISSKTKEPQTENRASDVIRENLTEYSAEVITMQFPSVIDGLKKVQFRLLWMGRKGDFNEETKSQKVVGIVQEIHNYGDASAYGAFVRLAQSWNVSPPLVKVHGGYGSYSDPDPSQARYTTMELTNFARDVFYNGIDLNILPMGIGADGDAEPLYFIPALPTALLYDNLTIGFGDQSRTVALNLVNVCDLVTAFGMHQSRSPQKSFDFAKHAEKFLPDFPNPGVLTNAEDLVQAYRRGEYDTKITLDGHVVLSHDKILIRSLPESSVFAEAKSMLQDAIREKKGTFDASINTIHHLLKEINIGDLSIELKRGVNVFDAWDEIRKLLKFSRAITPNPHYATRTGRIIRMSVLTLLYVWFDKRREIIMSSKRKRLEKMQRELRVVEARLIVYDYLDEVIEIIRSQNTRAEAVDLLRNRFNLSDFQANSLVQLEIGDLSKTSKSDLFTKRETQAAAIGALNVSFGKIGEEIAQEAQRLKKIYAMPRKTIIPAYIGSVSVAGGVVQFESTDELADIATRFPKGELRVTMYDGPHLLHITPDGKPSRRIISKYTRGEIYGLSFPGESGYTVAIKDGAACTVAGVIPGRRSDGYYYTPRFAKVLTRKGEVRTIDVTTDLVMRKVVGRGTNTDIIYLYPNTTETHYLAILNDREPNVVHLQRVDGGAGKIIVSPIGDLIISHSLTGCDWYLSIPESHLNRVNARIFHIVNAEAVLGGSHQIKLDLAASKTKKNPNFSMLA